jgi:hypothetical protein
MTAELQRRLGAGQQIWYGEKLAERWGFDNIQLGFDATGMNMSDEIAAGLIFPRKEDLLNYVESAFDLAERAVTAIDDEQFGSAEQPQPMTEGIWGAGTVGDAIIAHLTHDNRHLGMMECLLGLQGQRGTATQ